MSCPFHSFTSCSLSSIHSRAGQPSPAPKRGSTWLETTQQTSSKPTARDRIRHSRSMPMRSPVDPADRGFPRLTYRGRLPLQVSDIVFTGSTVVPEFPDFESPREPPSARSRSKGRSSSRHSRHAITNYDSDDSSGDEWLSNRGQVHSTYTSRAPYAAPPNPLDVGPFYADTDLLPPNPFHHPTPSAFPDPQEHAYELRQSGRREPLQRSLSTASFSRPTAAAYPALRRRDHIRSRVQSNAYPSTPLPPYGTSQSALTSKHSHSRQASRSSGSNRGTGPIGSNVPPPVFTNLFATSSVSTSSRSDGDTKFNAVVTLTIDSSRPDLPSMPRDIPIQAPSVPVLNPAGFVAYSYTPNTPAPSVRSSRSKPRMVEGPTAYQPDVHQVSTPALQESMSTEVVPQLPRRRPDHSALVRNGQSECGQEQPRLHSQPKSGYRGRRAKCKERQGGYPDLSYQY